METKPEAERPVKDEWTRRPIEERKDGEGEREVIKSASAHKSRSIEGEDAGLSVRLAPSSKKDAEGAVVPTRTDDGPPLFYGEALVYRAFPMKREDLHSDRHEDG